MDSRIPITRKEIFFRRIDWPTASPKEQPGHFYVKPETPPLVATDFVHDTSDPFDLLGYQIKAVVDARRTAFQQVAIVDTCSFGRVLFMDHVIQSSEYDEALYHEMLVQPAMLAHPAPRDVLIIGGGEGAALREVLAHRSVRRCRMIDIDREAVEMCRVHLPQWHRGAFDDPRAEIVFAEGRAAVEASDDRFDVIVIDVVDLFENGPAQRIYTVQFHRLLKDRLRPGGILTVQGLELSHIDYKEHAALARTLATVFAEVHSYRVPVPSYMGPWGFLVASDWFRPHDWRAETIDGIIRGRLESAWLKHLDGAFFVASLQLCKETRNAFSIPGPILEDDMLYRVPPDVFNTDPWHGSFPRRRHRLT